MNRIAIAGMSGRRLAVCCVAGLLLGVTAAAAPGRVWAKSATDAESTSADGAPAPAGPEASGAQVAEVVVTARRTEEKLHDVPVAVAALSGDALAEQHIASQADLQFATPGLIVRETGSSDQLNYSLRGQSIDAFSFAAPAVVAYFNEVAMGTALAVVVGIIMPKLRARLPRGYLLHTFWAFGLAFQELRLFSLRSASKTLGP